MPRRATVEHQPELFEDLQIVDKPSPPLPPRSTRDSRVLSGLPGATLAPFIDAADEDEPAEVWFRRLFAAFDRPDPPQGFLPLAEEALKACPGDIDLLLLAANAALIDGKHERALVFLKRYHKRAESPAEKLLRAFALNLAGQRIVAQALLKRSGLADPQVAFDYYPAGRKQVAWFVAQFNRIMQPEPSTRQRSPLQMLMQPAQARSGKAGVTTAKSRPAGKPGLRAAPPPRADIRPEPASQAMPPPLPLVDIEIPLTIALDLAPLTAALAQTPETDGRAFRLRESLAHLGLVQGFDELLCLPRLVGIEPLWHQIETVRKVLKQFRGRVLLADEVGLGKTIEAGMVLKEYAMRGMAERMLVLTPASLVGQWREELETKFGLAFATTYDPLLREDAGAFWDQPRIVASIATARRQEHLEALARRQLDIVVVDEAHHLRDSASAGWKLVDALNKRFLLLLSATPVQNDLVELYNLLTLLKPGIFKTLKEFRAAYMTPGKPREPANPDSLRQLMRGAMIRNTRAIVALKLPRRHASTIRVEPAAEEAAAYAAVADAARCLATEGGGIGRQRLVLHHLLAAAGSSPAAAAKAAERIAERTGGKSWRTLAGQLAAIPCSAKETALVELLRKNPDEKKLVFVQARATLDHLTLRLEAEGISLARFDGSMSGPDKDAAIAAFANSASVLLCTQSGGEGRNIQFCNTLINFDVPWNPMAIEQRIGRIDRIGQEREVFVFNLVTAGTVEEQVLGLLEEKISMFELVVGEVGAILGNVEEDREFPDLVLDAWLQTTDAGRASAFDALGAKLDAARRQHEGAKELDEHLFGQDFETG